ncbi:hypothetical protein [Methylobacterium sp. E-046]|uniref:hypothetical protein n=1 Tax=Methylobacterium sp. E-046 TaxID=2836576 RepID=UPI001FB8B9AA|nr:hypothetical protein [Methylobacterium sp. E-046]MCJ2099665.1 hypothetical protein [Methylobacterium sp. E-046]
MATLRHLERERGPGWRSPAEVIAALERITGRPFVEPEPIDPYERIEAGQLAQCREQVARGYREYAAHVGLLEARIAERPAAKKARLRPRAPNQIRQGPRAGEAVNPSRVLALLERRRLIERIAHRGPGSAVRLATAP